MIGTLHASSAESELLQNPEIAKFSGNVTLRQGDRRLRADRATYYREQSRADIEGDVQYREPGLLVRGESASIDTAQNSGELRQARFVMHGEHARGEAKLLRRNVDRTLEFEETVYTQCEPGHDDWQLAADSMHVDRETGQGTARNARLEVQGIPVLYTPYLRFPVDDRRMSGLLWPTFTNSSQNGLDVTTPYYFNLAPNYDATLLPRYMNDRGTMLGGEFRYLNRWSSWVTSGAILPNDDVAQEDRWLTSLEHTGKPLDGMHTHISYTEVSDEDYLRQLSSTGLEVQRSIFLPQTGQVTYLFGDSWVLGAKAQQFRLLDRALAEPYKILPRLELNRRFSGTPFTPDYSLTSEFTVFEHKDAAELTGQRLYLEPQLAYPMQWAAAFVRPAVGYQAISYNLDESLTLPGDESPSVGAAMANLDAGYFLERDTSLFGTAFLQTLEPRAFYLWVDSEDHSDLPNFDSSDLTFSFSQLFRTTRFSGHDRIADANQASLSVTSRLIDEESGMERVTASVGQISYFEDRRVTVCDAPRAQSQPSCRTRVPPAGGWERRATRRCAVGFHLGNRRGSAGPAGAQRLLHGHHALGHASRAGERRRRARPLDPRCADDRQRGLPLSARTDRLRHLRQPDQRDDRPGGLFGRVADQRPLEGIHALPVRFHQRLQSRGTDRAGIQFLLLVGAHGVPGRRGLGPGPRLRFLPAVRAARPRRHRQEHRPAVAGQHLRLRQQSRGRRPCELNQL